MHQRATIRLAALASAMVLAAGVASCSSDDGGDPLSTLTDPPTTTTAPSTTMATTTAVPATSAPDATTIAPPTTAPAPATETPVTLSNSTPAVPADVIEAVRVTSEREVQLLYEPTAPDTDTGIGEVAEAGSPYASAMRNRLSELRDNSVKFSPSEPSSNQLIVESVSYDGGAEATVQVCEITNDRIVSAVDPSVVVGASWDGRLHVTRTTIVMHKSGDGLWRRASVVSTEAFDGVDTCPLES